MHRTGFASITVLIAILLWSCGSGFSQGVDSTAVALRDSLVAARADSAEIVQGPDSTAVALPDSAGEAGKADVRL
ncbi:MAG: hypothetical protein ABIJ00_12205, partial [Candidatus Eisenbacteria bacterium]